MTKINDQSISDTFRVSLRTFSSNHSASGWRKKLSLIKLCLTLFHISLALEQSLRVQSFVLEKEPQIAQESFNVIFLFSLAQFVRRASLITSHKRFQTKYLFWSLTKILGDKLVLQNLKIHRQSIITQKWRYISLSIQKF